MAKIENLLEGGQGSLGNLVLYKMNGKYYIRSKPAQYKDKKSPAQLAQRQRLQVMNSFLRAFREPIRVTFASEAVGRSALQAAQSYNMLSALAGEYPDIYVNKNKVLLSRGTLPLPVSATLTVLPEGLLIEWENDADAAARHPHDTLVVMAKSSKTDSVDFRFTEARRSDGRYTWKPALPSGKDSLPDLWIAFRNLQQTEMSDSLFVG